MGNDRVRKILYITGTRADYGLMQSVLRAIYEHPQLELEIVATGMHIMEEFGMTINEIKKDNLKTHDINAAYEKDNKESMANFIGEFIQLPQKPGRSAYLPLTRVPAGPWSPTDLPPAILLSVCWALPRSMYRRPILSPVWAQTT